MNKIKIVLLSAVLALTLCACGPIHQPSDSEQKRADKAIEIATTRVIDALNDFAHPDTVGMNYEDMTYNELAVNVQNMYAVDADGYVLATAIESFERGIKEAGEIVRVNADTATATIDGNEIIVDVEVACETRYADLQIILRNDNYDHTVLGAAFNTRYTLAEKMSKAGLNTLIGMGTVFFMLIVIAILIGQLGPFTRFIEKVSAGIKKFFASFKNKSDKTEEGIDKAVEQIVKNETAENADAELVAVIAAAVAAYEGTTDTSGFVVRSIRKIKRQ